MSQEIETLINNIEQGNMTDAHDAFGSVMAAKVADILSGKRQEVAATMFNGESENGEEIQTDS